MMIIKSAYSEKAKAETIICPPGMTEQSQAAECDINNIMAKFTKTQNIDHLKKYESEYGVQDSSSLHDALNLVTNAQTMFNELPAKTRDRFKNDPGQFLDFVQDEKNHQEMFDLGLSQNPPEKQEPEAPEPIVEPPE